MKLKWTFRFKANAYQIKQLGSDFLQPDGPDVGMTIRGKFLANATERGSSWA